MARRKSIRKQLEEEFQKLTSPKQIKRSQLKAYGDGLIKLMKENIRKGISPITGKRFPAYKNPNRYPGKRFPGKKPRPVNLELSGDFLKALISKPRPGANPRARITFRTRLAKKKEQGHRVGVHGQPKRPIIPERNEKFSRKIQRESDRLILKILRQIFD